MLFMAMEWDHEVGSNLVKWVVIKCFGVGMQFGVIQAFPPGSDIAYFVNPETAERDAKLFAEYKNANRPPDLERDAQEAGNNADKITV